MTTENDNPFGDAAAAPAPAAPLTDEAPAGRRARLSRVVVRRTSVPFALLLGLAVLAAGGGAVVGHELWSPSSSTLAAPQPGSLGAGGFQPSGGGSFQPSTGTFGGGSSSSAQGTSASTNVTAIAAKVSPALVDVNSTFGYQHDEGAGTGIVLTSNGEVLTNNHVIEGATKISATDVGNGKTYTATVVGYDPSQDVAVLQLQGASGLATASIGNSAQAAVGQSIVAVGNAGGQGGTPSSVGGTVTALDQSITASGDLIGGSEQLSGLLETNADIQPGDSGGALVNSQGQVIGMNTAGSSSGFSGLGEGRFGNQGGFGSQAVQAYAVPINEAITTARQIEAGTGSTTVHVGASAFLGVEVGASGAGVSPFGGGVGVGPGYGGGLGFGQGSFGNGSSGSSASGVAGVEISGVLSGDPAAKAGLASGDVITAIDGTSVRSATALSAALLTHHPGDSISVTYTAASGGSHTVTVALTSGPAS